MRALNRTRLRTDRVESIHHFDARQKREPSSRKRSLHDRPRPVCVLKSRRFPLRFDDVSDGGSLNAFVMVQALLAKGIPVHIFTRREPGEASVFVNGLLTVYRVEYSPSRTEDLLERDYQEGVSFVEGVLRHPAYVSGDYQCVHSHHWTSAIGLEEALKPSSRWVHTPHLLALHKAEFLGVECPDPIASAEQGIVRRANHIVALSEHEKQAIIGIGGVQPERVLLLPNGVTDDFFALAPPESRYANSPVRVMTIGRICRQKGIDVLLDAVELLLRQGVVVSLTIAGGFYAEPVYEAAFRRRISSPPLAGAVSFIGQVPHASLPALLASAHVYAQPSRYESQGIALLEAMAGARAVVATDLPAVREFLTDGSSGILLRDTENLAAQLAVSIERLQRDPRTGRALGEAARVAATRFRWPATIEATMRALVPAA